MTLDLEKVAEHLPALIGRAQLERSVDEERRRRALELLHEATANQKQFEERIGAAQTSWTLALPHDGPPDSAYFPPPAPPGYSALAVDGSSIDVDRHLPVDCYVVNLGWIAVHYGDEPGAERDTVVDLQPTGETLLLQDRDDPSRESMIAGMVLSLVRSVRELTLLAERAAAVARDDRPLLALVDGNLALWNLDKPDLSRTISEGLKRSALDALDQLKQLAERRRVLFCAFTSLTGAGNLAHSLRLMACPMEHNVVCRECPGKHTDARPCDVAGLADDSAVMKSLLEPWQRSAVFAAHSSHRSRMAEKWYADAGHEIVFFYLKAGNEVARIELPAWMTDDRRRMELLHALLVHQCREGGDYPLVLQEAHEQAVISTGDRRSFSALIARECELNGIQWLISAKELSKHVRAI